jgi:hypothetical protein
MPEGAGFSGGEPMDIVIEGPNEWKEDWIEIKYSFQTKNYIPDDEILEASKQYPELCFILGCCDLNGDGYESYDLSGLEVTQLKKIVVEKGHESAQVF